MGKTQPAKQASVTARSLYMHGALFHKAAHAVRASVKIDPLPAYFLWGRTIELLLKSYLLAEGVSEAALKSRRFGHDLVALYREARRRSLDNLVYKTYEDPDTIRELNRNYRSKNLEYRLSGHRYKLPDPTPTQLFIERLKKGVQRHLIRKYNIRIPPC